MKPILPLPKHASNGFSIDSLIQKDRTDRTEGTCPSTPRGRIHSPEEIGVTLLAPTLPDAAAIAGRIPPLHPALPSHVRNLLLAGEHAQLQNHNEILNLQRSAAWAFQNHALPSISTLTRTYPQSPYVPLQATYPGIWSAQRDSIGAVNPWLLSRNTSGLLGFPFGHPDTSIFYHPYRKPKRIRTAFSPSQLLKLEHAFEKNHYVVGQERKDLAVKLNLSETQVKVWFQNRRTKFKRVKTDDSSDQESDDQPGVSGCGQHTSHDESLDQSDSDDDDH